MPTDDRTRMVTIRLLTMVRGELPWGPVSVAKARIWECHDFVHGRGKYFGFDFSRPTWGDLFEEKV